MAKRQVVRVLTVAAFLGIVGLQYAAGAQSSMPPGNIKAMNAMMDDASGLTFNFLPAVQDTGRSGAQAAATDLSSTDLLHVDVFQFPDLIQRLDVSNVVKGTKLDFPHLRVLLLPAVREGDKSHLELHFFTDDVERAYDGEVEIFITDGTKTVPGELLPAVWSGGIPRRGGRRGAGIRCNTHEIAVVRHSAPTEAVDPTSTDDGAASRRGFSRCSPAPGSPPPCAPHSSRRRRPPSGSPPFAPARTSAGRRPKIAEGT